MRTFQMIEPLESRLLFSTPPSTIDTSGVGLYDPTGNAATLDRQRDIWLVIHGLQGSKDDSVTQSVAGAVAIQAPDDQVLILNWADLAHTPPDNLTAVNNAWAAADAIATQVRAAGMRGSGRHLNLIGFSMGGEVEDRLAKDLGGVNRIIAIDPAAPDIGTDKRGHLIYGP